MATDDFFAVAAGGGRVVKYVADNMIAVFTDTATAVETAVRIMQALPAEGTPGAFTAAIGIDFGRLLLIEGADCYGDVVNVACKLGEDLACPCEILLTEAARASLGESAAYAMRSQPVTLAGIELMAYSVLLPSP